MALGHVLLPGIGAVVAVGVSAYLAHGKADKLAAACAEIEQANSKNKIILKLVTKQLGEMRSFEIKIKDENECLDHAVRAAYRKVRRFGFLSHLWRKLRQRFRGAYYTSEEFAVIHQLAAVVDEFIASFSS